MFVATETFPHPSFDLKELFVVMDSRACAIVSHTVLIPYTVHYTSEVSPARCVLCELYSF